MKLISLWVCIFLAIFVNQSGAQDDGPPVLSDGSAITPRPTTTTTSPTTTTTTRPTTITTTPPPTTITTTTKFPTPPTAPTPPSETSSTTYRSTTTKIPTPTTPKESSCGSNNLGDYKGGCDQSVPVIVMPKGRPIMERVLDWFKCGTPSCL